MRDLVISAAEFDELAAGDGDFRGALGVAAESKRLLLLHLVCEAALERWPALAMAADVEGSRAAIAAAQRADAERANRVLLYPAVGRWGMEMLRQLDRSSADPADDLGYLGAIAVAVTLLTRREAVVTVRVRLDRTLVLPSLGVLRVSADPGWVALAVRSGRLSVDSVIEQRIRSLTSAAGGREFDVLLDDVDPYRGAVDLAPAERLTSAAVDRWRARLDDGWSRLVRHHPARAAAIVGGVRSLVPLRTTSEVSEVSGSSQESTGEVALTEPIDGTALALALVHEFQHMKFHAVLDVVRLIADGPEQLFYAPWRPDPRPLRGLLNGAYAYLGVTDFWRVESGLHAPGRAAAAQFEFAFWRAGVNRAVTAARGSGGLTPAGEDFLRGMAAKLAMLHETEVPAAPLAAAIDADADQWLTWRLRNVRPSRETVARFADAWRAGEAPPTDETSHATVVPGRPAFGTNARLALVRRELTSPVPPRDGARTVIEAADLAWVRGHYVRARRLYLEALRVNPARDEAWAGLALTDRRLRSPARWTLEPELAKRIHAELASTSAVTPEDVVGWLSGPDVRPAAAR